MQKRPLWSLVLPVGLAAALLAPLNATEPMLETWVVTYDAPPTAEQVETLKGIATGVHAYQHLPAAVAVVQQ